MIAFITAVNTYDPQKNASFRTYAAACINNRIISVLRSRNSQKNIPQDMMRNIDDGEDFQDFPPTRRIYIPRRRTMPDLRICSARS